MIRTLFFPLYRFFRLIGFLKNIRAAIYFSQFPGNHDFTKSEPVQWKNGGLFFARHDLHLTKNDIHIFNGRLDTIFKYIARYKIEKDEQGRLLIVTHKNGQTIRIIADSSDVLFAIDEIFHEELYDFFMPGKFIVLDVGMNRGLASMYFSCFDNVEHIYGFEPFKPTLQLALDNLNSNPGPAKKITPCAFGLADKTKKISVPLKTTGFLGASIYPEHIVATNSGAGLVEEVEVRNISDVLAGIMNDHPNTEIFIKLDCEGAEFDIITELDHKEMLKKISILIIEWHGKDKAPITDLLIKNDFVFMSPGREIEPNVGMIYSFNPDNIVRINKKDLNVWMSQ